MSYRRPRTGIFAVVDGVEYPAESHPEYGVAVIYSTAEANPDPARFSRDEENRMWRAEVFTSECDRLDEVVTYASHLGYECQLVDLAPDGAAGLYYLGPEKAKAEQYGFVQVEPGTWAKTVNVYELNQISEHHRDLLFGEWVAGGHFAEQAG